MERESALKIFEKVFGWAKLVAAVGGGLLTILALITTWRFFDLRSVSNTAQASIETKRQSAEDVITKTAATATGDISKKSAASVQAIDAAALSATDSSKKAQALAEAAGSSITSQAQTVTNEARRESAAITSDVASARKQIQSAAALEPQMQAMQTDLQNAQTQIAKQQTLLTSSEEFAKQIFSSRVLEVVDPKTTLKSRYAVTDAAPNKLTVTLYYLLSEAPVKGTLQPQFYQVVSAPNSFIWFHNLLILFINKSGKEELLGKQISISYFPDKSDRPLLKTLEVHNNRVYADGEALPRFGQLDPDFEGSKWFEKGYQPIVPQDDAFK